MNKKLIPTKRAMIDPIRDCNLNCRFCYYRHDTAKGFTPTVQVKDEIDAAVKRGNNYIDITGGEPTMHPDISEIIQYALSVGVKTCVITNGMIRAKIERINRAGVDDWLVSIHGLEKTHDYLVNCKGAWRTQKDNIKLFKNFRVNVVMNKFNQNELLDLSKYLVSIKPTIVNFINMNPHHGWKNDPETKNIIADLDVLQKQLLYSIRLLEKNGIGVNVRYYPMCKIAKVYRRCICNDLHVVFDPYEWDYNIQPKTVKAFKEWSENLSNNVENKGEPCCNCSLQNICGGINKYFYEASNKTIKPVIAIVEDNCYYYRQDSKTIVE